MDRRKEFDIKVARLRERMEQRAIGAVRLETQANQAWLGCGADTHIVYASTEGAGTLLVTRDAVHLLCDNIERERLLREEFFDLPIDAHEVPWPELGSTREGAIRDLSRGASIGSDLPMPETEDFRDALADCRASLVTAEVDRYRQLGRDTGGALEAAARAIMPGMTEHAIAGELAYRVVAGGMVPNLILVAADERIAQYRHPIPTDRVLHRTAMIVVCARRQGLIANATRMVHFGSLPNGLRRRHDAVVTVDAALTRATVPGARYGDIFAAGMAAYEAAGFPDEWRLHHQGGPTGYMGREFKATSDSEGTVVEFQAVAWNPSITGTKSEETILVTSSGQETLTASPGWPRCTVTHEGAPFERADILVVR